MIKSHETNNKFLLSRWPNVRVCPLVPLWTDCVPGQFIRSLQELSSVFRSLFGSDLRGLNHTWIRLTECIGEDILEAGASQALLPTTVLTLYRI